MTATSETVDDALRIADDALTERLSATSDPELAAVQRRIQSLRDGRRPRARSTERFFAYIEVNRAAAEHTAITGERLDPDTIDVAASIATEWLITATTWGCDPPPLIFELSLETALTRRQRTSP